MTKIALLLVSGATPSSVTATLDMFNIATRFVGEAALHLEVFSPRAGRLPLAGGLQLDTRPLPPQLSDFDAVILPGFFANDITELIQRLESSWQPVITLLKKLPPTTLIAASCYGTFVLAESGLLDEHTATTTWWLRDEFRTRYPRIRLDAAKALVEDGNLLTAGAMTAHTLLSLQLLRRLIGHAAARQVASIMLVDESNTSQQAFVTLQRDFADPLVAAAIELMERTLQEAFSATALADQLHVSYRTLHRRFRNATGETPLAYLQALRVERAKALLETSRLSVEQIATGVGYADLSSFRRLFTRQTGLSPAQYRKRFRRDKA